MRASVLICTYKRPDDLSRCMAALRSQVRLPDELIVVFREDDAATRDFLRTGPQQPFTVTPVVVAQPGTVIARNAGLDVLRTDVVAMIDDDTAPLPDWLDRICAHFEGDESLGAVGGRDRPAGPNAPQPERRYQVGLLQMYGRYIGNHHCGIGPARPVDLLKGANMSFRAKAVRQIRFDRRLRGKGAQPCEDLAFSLAVRGAGWKVLYDPDVVVDHYEGEREELRHYAEMLPVQDGEAFGELMYNWVVAIWDHFTVKRHLMHIAWQVLVGTRVRPGLVQAVRFTPSLKVVSWQRFWYTQKALVAAYLELSRRSGEQQVRPQPVS